MCIHVWYVHPSELGEVLHLPISQGGTMIGHSLHSFRQPRKQEEAKMKEVLFVECGLL